MLDCRAAGMTDREPVDGLILTWKGLGEADVEYRIHEIAPALLGMEQVLADRTSSSPQMAQELASLRSMAEKLSAQLAALGQRVQRLEILVPPQGSTSAVEPVKWPAAMPTIPIAMRSASPNPETAPARPSPEIRPAMPVPQNGKPQI